MNAIFRALKLVSYDKINQVCNEALMANKQLADEIRKNAFDTLATLNAPADVPKIKELVKKTQDEVDAINNTEKELLKFINSIKG
jgi:hypothetical protein